MSAGWVACNVRARALSSRRLGRTAARGVAASPSLDVAIATLVQSPYGHDVRVGQTLAEAQRAVVATVVWNLRVLAGWAPGPGVAMLRALVGVLEIANVEDHLQGLSGVAVPPPYQLGGLAVAWPRLAGATGADELRRLLAASSWGDPGGDTPRGIVLGMRTALSDRVMSAAPAAAPWAVAATALLYAREIIADGNDLPLRARPVASHVIGRAGVAARTLPELVAALTPARAGHSPTSSSRASCGARKAAGGRGSRATDSASRARP